MAWSGSTLGTVGHWWLDTAVGASIAWVLASIRRQDRGRAAWLGIATLALTFAAVGALASDLLRVDPASRYVQSFSSDATPVRYRLAGLWGGMEGSLLVWSMFVAAVFSVPGFLGRRSGDDRPDPDRQRWEGLIGATLVAAFLVITRVWASPFQPVAVPTGTGNGLPAVLQHPAMLYHPPLLYLGLVLLGVPYARTLAAVWARRLDRAWVSSIERWLGAAWIVLGAGMVTGSHWAYGELGWGGFWAWDPVENSALVPWLLVTAALHAAVAVRRTGDPATTAATMVIAAFVAMTVGVYATRSGGTGSIHAFAESVDVGRALVVVAGVHLAIAVFGLLRVGPTTWTRPRFTRSGALSLHVATTAAGATVIAAATFGPIVVELFSDRRTAVRAVYYERLLTPLVVVALVGMAVGPALRWSGGVRRPRRIAVGAVIGVSVATVAHLVTVQPGQSRWLMSALVAVAGAGIGAALAGATAPASARSVGVGLAHAGFATVLLAAAGSATGTDTTLTLRVGQRETVRGETVELVDLTTARTERYESVRADVLVGDGSPDRFRPELRAYEDQQLPTAEAAFAHDVFADTIVVMTSIGDGVDQATLTVRRRPLLPLVWWGAAIMLGGGSLAGVAARRTGRRTARDAARCRAATPTPPTTAADDGASTSTSPPPGHDHRRPVRK